MARKPRKESWLGEFSDLAPVSVSDREYGIRLDRIAEALYDELRQLSQASFDENEQPSTRPNLVHAESTSIDRSLAPVQEKTHGKPGNAA